jgi:hypothetical protein
MFFNLRLTWRQVLPSSGLSCGSVNAKVWQVRLLAVRSDVRREPTVHAQFLVLCNESMSARDSQPPSEKLEARKN